MSKLTIAVSDPDSGNSFGEIQVGKIVGAVLAGFGGRSIPPLRVVNEILKYGYWEFGGSTSYQWEPFSIDEEAYKEVSKQLLEAGFAEHIYPDCVTDIASLHLYELSKGDEGFVVEIHPILKAMFTLRRPGGPRSVVSGVEATADAEYKKLSGIYSAFVRERLGI